METQELKAQLEGELMNDEDVTAVGVGKNKDGEEVVVVNVKHGKAHTLALPDNVDTSKVEVRETGEFHAEVVRGEEPQAIDRKGRHRPVPAGVSAGHVNITAGTAGFVVTDGETSYVASNNHVYADVNQASEGDTIVQPGPTDGGSAPDDESATLAGYVPIEAGAKLDFAWANPQVDHNLELAGVGTPKGEPLKPSIGDTLIKSGRTTGVTEGEVEQIDVSVNVNYGDIGTFKISECIITTDMSQGGDSGSAVLEKGSMRPAGVLFAGSSSATVHNLATNIEPETGLTIVTEEGDTMPTANVELTLTKETEETGTISATVKDTSGNPVADAAVTIEGPTDKSAIADSNGQAEFTSVPLGSYTVSASRSGYQGDSVSITADDFN